MTRICKFYCVNRNSRPHSIDRLATYLDVASAAALATGKVLQACWGNLESIVEKGRLGDLVTEANQREFDAKK
jgi:hypothetical protein